MENPIKMDDLGVPIFLETPIWPCNTVGAMGHILYTLKKDQNTSRAIHDLKTTHVKEPNTNNHPATLLKLQIGFFWGSFSKSTKNMMFHRPKTFFCLRLASFGKSSRPSTRRPFAVSPVPVPYLSCSWMPHVLQLEPQQTWVPPVAHRC